jgi:hypothetical protein
MALTPKEAERTRRLEGLVKNAIDALDRHTYTAYMHALIALGSFMEKASDEIDIPAEALPKKSVMIKRAATLNGATAIKDKKAVIAAMLRKFYDLPHDHEFKFEMPVENLQVIQNGLAFRAFEAAWEDDALREKSERQLAVKADVNRSVRRQIKLGMLVLANCTHMKFVAESNPATAIKYNKDASNAIKNFKTPLQKVLFVASRLISVAVALTFGFTNAISVLGVFGVTGAALFASVGGIAALTFAVAIFIAGAATNYLIFKKPVFGFLNNLLGKDKFFEGLISYVDEKGEKKRLSAGKIVALGFSFILAASVGGSVAALVMTYIASLGAMAGAAAFVFPPLSIALALIAGLSLTALMFGSFGALLQSKSWKAMFTTPFKNALRVFNSEAPENKLKSQGRIRIEKVITMAFVGLLAALAFLGQVANSLAQSGSLTGLFASFGLAGSIATGLGFAIGMGVAFVGQIPFIFESAGRAVTNIATRFRDALTPKFKTSRYTSPARSPKEALMVKPPKENTAVVGVKVFGAFFNALGNGMLVVQPLKEIMWSFFSFVGSVASGATSFAAGIGAATAVPGEDDKKKQRSSEYRIRVLLADSGDAIVPLPIQHDVMPITPIKMSVVRAKSRPESRVYSSIIFGNAARKELAEENALMRNPGADEIHIEREAAGEQNGHIDEENTADEAAVEAAVVRRTLSLGGSAAKR